MNKIVLYPKDCIEQIKKYITNQKWTIISEKYDFKIPYISTYDKNNYKAQIDWAISFKTNSGFIHKMYFYFLNFYNDNVFKIGDIKSREHPYGQMTTKVAGFERFNSTGNLGFKNYQWKNGKPNNASHYYQNLFKALDYEDKSNELTYVCVLLKYHNHAGEWPRTRYYANSFQNFMNSGITKIQNFEVNRHSELDLE